MTRSQHQRPTGRTRRLTVLVLPAGVWSSARIVVATIAIASCAGCAVRSTARSEIRAAVAAQSPVVFGDQDRAQALIADGADLQDSLRQSDHPTDGLAALLATAERDNPAIAASRDNARAAAERVVLVTSLPDPQLTTKTLPEPVRTAEGDNHFILSVVQKIPAPEKLHRAGHIALQELRMAIHTMEETRQRVRGGVKRASYRLFLVRKTIEILRADRDLLRTLIETARAQLRAGKRSQADVLRGEVELAVLEARLIELAAKDQRILASLNAFLNREPSSPIPELREPELRAASLDEADLLELARERNPSLARLTDKVEREREGLLLARLSSVPDFTLGFEWMSMEGRDAFQPRRNANGTLPRVSQLSEEGTDNWGIIFGITLPIWYDRNAAAVREAQEKLGASQQERLSTQRAVERDSFDALKRFEAQRDLAVLFRDAIIPQAEQTYRVSLAEYRGATTGFDTVIDDHRRWLGLSIRYYAALAEMEIALADLEVATGGELVYP